VIAVRVKASTRGAVALVAVLLASVAFCGSAQAHPRPGAADPAVITTWDAIAIRTVAVEAAKHPAVTQLYLGIMSAAVYDAVVTIEGGYVPYGGRLAVRGRRHASPQAAAATAAYRILAFYFPASADALAADYQTSLALISEGRAKDNGVAVGEAAAALLEGLREGDGRDDASIVYSRTPAPGVWRPTPPAMLPFAVPWLGFVRPLVLSSPAQTETALFWSDNPPVQFQAGFRDLVTRRGLDIARSARTFAVLNASGADAAISCWRAKFDFAFWRPITAITLADTDGNPATVADPAWTPLIATPPYPEYPSGHACLVGAYARALSALFGARHIDLNVSSAVTMTARHYETAWQLNQDTMNARIWLGLHFRRAMTDGNGLGQDVARFVLRNAFQPAHRRDRSHR
jgi:hypothetical protein